MRHWTVGAIADVMALCFKYADRIRKDAAANFILSPMGDVIGYEVDGKMLRADSMRRMELNVQRILTICTDYECGCIDADTALWAIKSTTESQMCILRGR